MKRDLRLRPAAGEMGDEARNGCEEDMAATADADGVQNVPKASLLNIPNICRRYKLPLILISWRGLERVAISYG